MNVPNDSTQDPCETCGSGSLGVYVEVDSVGELYSGARN